jgi:hypothetical protein
MKNSLVDTGKVQLEEEFPLEYAELLPKNLALPNTVQYENINITMEKLKYLLVNNDTKATSQDFQPELILSSSTTPLKKSILSGDKLVKVAKHIEVTSRSRSNAPGKAKANEIHKESYDYKMNYESRSPEIKPVKEHKKDIKEILRNRADIILGRKPQKQVPKNNKSPGKYDKPIPIDKQNMVLLNTLNYKNIDKWENSGIENSIEEIYDIDDNKMPKFNSSFKK